ncbi:MAG: LPS export ABC transporter periplasmic protein LptC [Acidobacteria bacterium]|nr:LPS export ABC transporter periplasmic protein LptC [Acidobacteriota bacterium]MBS1866479.1 LPS export ABC transporter periplasmic protein LptC [Acidobacteriota bacterium]
MRRSEAAKYARWSAAVALCLAGVTAAVYLARGWQRRQDKKNAPPPSPSYVDKQLSGISFSKVEGNVTIYTVEASHSTDFKGEASSLLEDVKITVFGKAQDRNDILHTQTCRYSKNPETVDCSGPVQMDLMSAADAKLLKAHPEMAASRLIHVETKAVTFERDTGIAKTSEPITFRLPNGTGDAKGVEYHSNEGQLQLLHDVHFSLTPAASRAGKQKHTEPVQIRGTRLEFDRDSHLMRLAGPVEAATAMSQLKAGGVAIEMDESFRARKILASAAGAGLRPELHSRGTKGAQVMNADSMSAVLTADGKVAGISAEGNVSGSSDGEDEKQEMASNEANVEFWPASGKAKEITLKGAVKIHTSYKKSGDVRDLQSDAVRMAFLGAELREKSRPQLAESLAPGTVVWTNGASKGATAGEQTKLQADRLHLDFGDEGKAKLLQALGKVRLERSAPGKGIQTATGKNGAAQLEASGGWSQMELHGDVRLKDAEKSAQSDDALFVRATQLAVLTGHVQVRDATTETRATKLTLHQDSGEIFAEGSVRSTDYAGKPGAVQIGSAPANITSDYLQANSKTGRALYKGHARLWQGESTMEAESIELQRDARVLNAAGNVRAVFLQAPAASAAASASPTAPSAKKLPQLWRVFAGNLTYWDKENRAHLEKDVAVQSAEQKIHSAAMDIYFARANSANGSAPGAQQISRAVGTGGVTVEQGQRRATADRGEYTASDGKFVMTGGTPTIFDASEGTTTGHQLTFFLADATIIVDSENGSRTLTKHRVEK